MRALRAIRTMLASTFLGRCPNCQEASMFRSPYGVRETCPVCGVRFERDGGSWLGAMVMSYGAAIVALLLLAWILIPRYGLFEGFAFVLAGGAVLAVLLTYRPAKGWFVWWMWTAGFVVPDGAQAPRPAQSRARSSR